MTHLPQVIVTAGGASEPIDAVRSWGNPFTGRTGMAIADAVRAFADVTLLLARSATPVYKASDHLPGKLTIRSFTTSAELADQLKELIHARPAAVFMTAAVSDYRPVRVVKIVDEQPADGIHPNRYRWTVEEVGGSKIKSDYEQIAILGMRNPKIVDLLRQEWGYDGLIYKFKLEAGVTEQELIAIASASRLASRAQVMVANTLDMVDDKTGGAWILDDAGCRRVARAQLAGELADDLRRRLAGAPQK
jgi:phosphopantothenate-cysteine ligase/phosphopantothenoylcysteine decarboxylase/phosphopantothenate--cysteine ligase